MRLQATGGWRRLEAWPRGIRRRLCGDGGAATPVAATACCVLLVVTALALQIGAAAVARHQAQVAADAAALAGAAQILSTGSPCDAAVEVAAANGAQVLVCDSDGADLLVETLIDGRWGPDPRPAVGRARAGPTAGQWSAPGTTARADAAG